LLGALASSSTFVPAHPLSFNTRSKETLSPLRRPPLEPTTADSWTNTSLPSARVTNPNFFAALKNLTSPCSGPTRPRADASKSFPSSLLFEPVSPCSQRQRTLRVLTEGISCGSLAFVPHGTCYEYDVRGATAPFGRVPWESIRSETWPHLGACRRREDSTTIIHGSKGQVCALSVGVPIHKEEGV